MSGPVPRILVVEDDEAHGEALRLALETEGHEVEMAGSVDAALDRLRARRFDLVVTDLRLGERDGLDLLREARRRERDLSVFLITGHGTVETAVRAMREGAADYLTKPVNVVELRARVARELEKRRLSEDNRALRLELESRFGMEGMVGGSPAMKPVFDLVRQAGPTDATVLILGESGTGKELVARSLHRLSPRARRRFVALNCAAMSETLIESELFGHVKGAFTGAHAAKEGKFEFAAGGTLFLDEIGDMPLPTQAKLLRVLEDRCVIPVGANEERHVDVRILAATNRDLTERVREGRFREDLYYRLAVMTVELPPLRARPEDLPLLADHFRREFAERHGKAVGAIAGAVLERLRRHAWPGNVRELRNVLETMVVVDRDGELGLDDLPPSLRPAGPPAGEAPTAPAPAPPLAGRTLDHVVRELVLQTLASVNGNRQRAAQLLRIGERTLYRKIDLYEPAILAEAMLRCEGDRERVAEALDMAPKVLERRIDKHGILLDAEVLDLARGDLGRAALALGQDLDRLRARWREHEAELLRAVLDVAEDDRARAARSLACTPEVLEGRIRDLGLVPVPPAAEE